MAQNPQSGLDKQAEQDEALHWTQTEYCQAGHVPNRGPVDEPTWQVWVAAHHPQDGDAVHESQSGNVQVGPVPQSPTMGSDTSRDGSERPAESRSSPMTWTVRTPIWGGEAPAGLTTVMTRTEGDDHNPV